MRRTAATLLALVLLLLAADLSARKYEEARVASAIGDSLHMAAAPDVALHGFPFIAELLRGRISSATLDATRLREGSITFSDVHLFLRRLTFSTRHFLEGNLRSIHAETGVGESAIKTAAVNGYLADHSVPFRVSFEHGRTIARLGPVSATIDVGLTIVNGDLQISGDSNLLPTVTVPLPSIFNQVTYGSVRPGDGELVVDFGMQHPTLDLQP